MLHLRITSAVEDDLERKMVLVTGPRQCGKTTLAKHLIDQMGGVYFNWDVAEHRRELRKGPPSLDEPLWVLDELHKMRGWSTWLKGLYDQHGEAARILITGSARLDTYRRGGDSLQGRYFRHRLHPLTLGELHPRALSDADHLPRFDGVNPAPSSSLEQLLALGGFPEPLLGGSATGARRWRLQYGENLIRQDLRDLQAIRELDKVEQLFERLETGVGSLLSMNALHEELEVAQDTVKSWIEQLERLFGVFRLLPWGGGRVLPRVRALKKASKLYFWDWARVAEAGPRFENLVVAHLLRLVHYLEDELGEAAELRFFRDRAGHEVDAIVLRSGAPWMAVEVKRRERSLDKGLRYLLERTPIPFAYQIHLEGQTDRRLPNINGAELRLMPAQRFLAGLP